MIGMTVTLHHFYNVENGVPITKWKTIYSVVFSKWEQDLRDGILFSNKDTMWNFNEDESVITLKDGHGRHILPCLAIISNIGALAIVWTIMINLNFATQVLAICVINSATFTLYYGLMKVRISIIIHVSYSQK